MKRQKVGSKTLRKMPTSANNVQAVAKLCFRCERRALFLERGEQYRYECGVVKGAIFSCYAFVPVKPLTIKPSAGDNRPFLGPAMIAARVNAVGILDSKLRAKCAEGNAVTLYWVPPNKSKTKS
jgi:hypothetical protein